MLYAEMRVHVCVFYARKHELLERVLAITILSVCSSIRQV